MAGGPKEILALTGFVSDHPDWFFLIFFGLQRRFFFAETAPHSLQTKSPGFDLRFLFFSWHRIAVSLMSS
jgi:hypothetical protein